MVVCSNLHASVVPTTIVHLSMVGGFNDLVVWVSKKALGGDDMSVVFEAPSIEKCLSLRGGSSSTFTFLCPVAIGLVIRRTNIIFIPASLKDRSFFTVHTVPN